MKCVNSECYPSLNLVPVEKSDAVGLLEKNDNRLFLKKFTANYSGCNGCLKC